MHRTSTSSFSMQHGVDASSATSASPGNLPNPLSAASHESGSSILPPISTFPDSPAASHHYLNSSGLPNVSNEPKRQHDPHNLHIQPEYGTSNTAGQNSTTSFFPSSIPSASFPADSFLTGLYDNIPPPPQQASDFSFLESWPFWLAGTAANSPESAQNNGMKEASADGTYHQSSSYMSTHNQPQEVDWLADSQLIPAIASFFEKLHPIMPIFTRSWILDRIDKDHHRSQPSLAAMLLALCSLAKIQPVKAADRISRSQRNEQARALLEQSVKVRANVLLGQTHSLDEVLASFYSFATLFGMQEHDAATFRLREAITLAQLMKLNVHESYMFLDHGEQERRLRTYWLLCITER